MAMTQAEIQTFLESIGSPYTAEDIAAFIAAGDAGQPVPPEVKATIQQIAVAEGFSDTSAGEKRDISEGVGPVEEAPPNYGSVEEKAWSAVKGWLGMGDGVTRSPEEQRKLDDEKGIADGSRSTDPMEIIEKQAEGVELTEGETEIIENLEDADVTALKRAILAAKGQNVPSWIFSEGGLAGVAPNAVSWVGLYDLMLSRHGQEFVDAIGVAEDIEGLEEDDYKTAVVLALFDGGATDMNVSLVSEWAYDNGYHETQMTDGGQSVSTVRSLADSYGWDYGTARRILQTGKAWGMDPHLAARVYAMAQAGNPGRLTPIGEEGRLQPAKRKPFDSTQGSSDYGRNRGTEDDGGGSRTEYGRPKNTIEGAAPVPPPQTMSLGRFNSLFQQNMQVFGGSELTSLVGVFEKDLAQRMYDDPYSLTSEELQKVDGMINGAASWANVSGQAGAAQWLTNRLNGSRNVAKVDKDGVREAARTLAAAWNMPGLDDKLLNQIVSDVVGPQMAAIKAAQGNPFNPEIRADVAINAPGGYSASAERLRGTSMYKELFGNLRDGESEEQYANRFSSESEQQFGDSDLEATRAGMRSGSRETVRQAGMSSGEAFNSSEFQKKLKTMGAAFKSMT